MQNTLVNTLFVKYASEELKKKYLPRLANESVRRARVPLSTAVLPLTQGATTSTPTPTPNAWHRRWAASACPKPAPAAMRLHSRSGARAGPGLSCALQRLKRHPVGEHARRRRGAPPQTKAVKSGSDYIISGTKMWITNSGEADIFLVFANVDFDKGYKGITCFVVEKEWGVQVGRKENKVRDSDSAVVAQVRASRKKEPDADRPHASVGQRDASLQTISSGSARRRRAHCHSRTCGCVRRVCCPPPPFA